MRITLDAKLRVEEDEWKNVDLALTCDGHLAIIHLNEKGVSLSGNAVTLNVPLRSLYLALQAMGAVDGYLKIP